MLAQLMLLSFVAPPLARITMTSCFVFEPLQPRSKALFRCWKNDSEHVLGRLFAIVSHAHGEITAYRTEYIF
jgi:hypothetical protein